MLNAEHATEQSVTVVVPAEQESVEDELLGSDVGVGDGEGRGVFVGCGPSPFGTSGSTIGGSVHMLSSGMQGSSNAGNSGSFHVILGIGGRFQITGRMVDELWPSLLVVSHPLLVTSVPVIKFVEKLGGTVVIVDVGINASELSVVDPVVLCEDCDIEEVEDSVTIVGVSPGVGVFVGLTGYDRGGCRV